MVVFPNAKINLGLNVVARRADGYHNIETVFYPITLCDALEVLPADALSLQFLGMPVPGACNDNLVVRAFRLLQRDFSLPEVAITLLKKSRWVRDLAAVRAMRRLCSRCSIGSSTLGFPTMRSNAMRHSWEPIALFCAQPTHFCRGHRQRIFRHCALACWLAHCGGAETRCACCHYRSLCTHHLSALGCAAARSPATPCGCVARLPFQRFRGERFCQIPRAGKNKTTVVRQRRGVCRHVGQRKCHLRPFSARCPAARPHKRPLLRLPPI